METSKIGIFESISLLSILMPYYGSSPEGFLLLFKLSKRVRVYMFEHYKDYRGFMLKYEKMVKYNICELLKMELPLDLFKFAALEIYTQEDAELLAGLISKLINKEGVYFVNQCVGDQICIEKIYVKPEYMQDLHPLIESLNEKIKINSFDGQNLSEHNSLLDLIVLDDIFDNEDKLKACFFKDSELKEINPIYKSFKRIRNVYCEDFKEAQNILDALVQTSIEEIENIKFGKLNEEDFEQITNRLENYKIHTLDYSGFSCELISEKEFEIISQINLRKLYLGRLDSIPTLFGIFSYLREDINVSFGGVSERAAALMFEKTSVNFKRKNDMIKVYCDKIRVTYEEDLNQESIYFLENYVCISNFYEIHVENLTTKTPFEDFPLGDLKNNSCILIPSNNLSLICLDLSDIYNIFENEINKTNFKKLSLKTKIIVYLYSMDDLAELNERSDYFPEHSELVIDVSDTNINNTNFYEALLLEILLKFKLTSLTIHNGDRDENILNSLLKTHSIQETLEHFSINNLGLSKCTDVIKLFDEFKRIKTIEIIYHYPEADDGNKETIKCKQKMKQLVDKMKQKHSKIEINIRNFYRYH